MYDVYTCNMHTVCVCAPCMVVDKEVTEVQKVQCPWQDSLWESFSLFLCQDQLSFSFASTLKLPVMGQGQGQAAAQPPCETFLIADIRQSWNVPAVNGNDDLCLHRMLAEIDTLEHVRWFPPIPDVWRILSKLRIDVESHLSRYQDAQVILLINSIATLRLPLAWYFSFLFLFWNSLNSIGVDLLRLNSLGSPCGRGHLLEHTSTTTFLLFFLMYFLSVIGSVLVIYIFLECHTGSQT